MTARFWIIGGEYTDTNFDRLVEGSERLFGPYPDRPSALLAWREVAEETRSSCCSRFTIAQERDR